MIDAFVLRFFPRRTLRRSPGDGALSGRFKLFGVIDYFLQLGGHVVYKRVIYYRQKTARIFWAMLDLYFFLFNVEIQVIFLS